MSKLKFFLGRVTNVHGTEREQSGYVTYGATPKPEDEVGEITIEGDDAPAIAERICRLLNAE